MSYRTGKRMALMASVCGAALLLTDAALAAEPNSGGIEEILVTSRKREERLQDVPDTISAFTSETIEGAGIRSVADVAEMVPNLSIVQTQQPGVDFLVIRGVGQARNQEPPVAMVIDGVQLTSSYGLTQELFDVERIEVLKGPQGALYGRNAIAGAINIVTKKPTNEFEGRLTAGVGNGFFWETSGALSGPIVEDRLLFRVAGSYQDFDGNIHNVTQNKDVNFFDTLALRGRLLFTPNEKLTFDLRASYEDMDSGAAYFKPVSGLDDLKGPVVGEYPGVAERKLEEYALKIDYEFSGATLTSVTSYSKTNSLIDEEVDYFPIPILHALQVLDVDAFSQELRLTSNQDSRFRWMFGGYYLDLERSLGTDISVDFDNYLAFLFGGETSTEANFVPLSSALALDDDKAYAGFGQINYDILDNLELTVALRYDKNKKRQFDAILQQNYAKNFDLWQPKVSLAYTINDDAMVYATVGRGFRSGGFNATPTLGRIFDAEETTSYEVGFKTTWFDRMLSVNGAVFQTDYDDRQEFILIVAEGAQALINIPKSRVRGAELEVAARPVEGLELQASLGLMDTKIRQFDGTAYGFPPTTVFVGNQLPFAYGWSYTLAAQYRVPVYGDFDLVTRVDYSGKGDMAWHLDGFDTQPSVHLVNARVSLETEQIQFTIWAENLFNEKYHNEFIAPQWSGGLSQLAYPGQPRRYGARATYRF